MASTNFKRARLFIVILLALILGAVAIRAEQEVYEPQQKLQADDGASADLLGAAVSLDGNWAALGAPSADAPGRNSGAVYVFKRSQQVWTERRKVLDPAGGIGDRFGAALALGSSTLAVGSPGDDDAGLDAGSCQLFRLDGQRWRFEQALRAPDTTTGDAFGDAVALFADRLLVGAPGDDDACGSAHVFVWGGSDWGHEQKLVPGDGAPADHFGAALSIDADSAAVGAWLDDDQGSGSGSVTVFRDTGTSWVVDQKLTPPDGAAGDHYGRTVSLDGDRVLVGAPGAQGAGPVSGVVYVHLEENAVFLSPQRLLDPDGAAWDELGDAVVVQGSTVMVGAPSDDAATGSVSVFDVPPPTGWATSTDRNLSLPGVLNVGLAGSPMAATERHVAIGGSEWEEGDLNGDGDTLDTVVHIYDRQREKLRNLGVASFSTSFYQGFLLVAVSEFDQGADLNGDGDSSDFSVLHVYELATRTLTNLQTAILSDGFTALGGGFVPFLVYEPDQGGVDLNGDGDALDAVLHTYELATATLRNHRVAGWGIGPSSDTFISFLADEASQGATDLNFDGDATDSVVIPFHVPSKGLGHSPPIAGSASQVNDTGTYLVVSEAQQGNTDLNGDGDTSDFVAHFDYYESGSIDNLYRSTFFWTVERDGLAAFSARESSDGQDYNGDGDQLDDVVHSYDPLDGMVNHGVAGSALLLRGREALIQVSETSQGGTDLNGDGDVLDEVPVLDERRGTGPRSLGIAGGFAAVSADQNMVLFWVSESAQGGTDLNEDGDALDTIVAAFDWRTGGLALVPRAIVGVVKVSTPYTLLNVSEAGSGEDLNGDGDMTDYLAALHHLPEDRLYEPGLATSLSAQLVGSRAVVAVSESGQGNTDLNGDGDSSDEVLHVLLGNSQRAVNLRLAGSVSFLAAEGFVLVNVSEAGQGQDYNGDGDQTDSVVFLVEL